MMQQIPLYIYVVFILTVLVSVWTFFRASQRSWITLMVIAGWLVLQGGLAWFGFYQNTTTTPPRFPLAVLPTFIFIVVLLRTRRAAAYIRRWDTALLTLFHTIRFPVELVLFWLAQQKVVPELMTFEGRNFDILSGLTAPLVYYFGYKKRILPRSVLLLWNFAALGLLANIVLPAVLSLPSPIQQLAFDQPNIAVLYFPFVWLPCCLVPMVLFAHLVALRAIFGEKD